MSDLSIVSGVSQAEAERARKIKALLPYGRLLTEENALALDAYSRAHGLDPFNGECFFLVREKKNDRGEVTGREELGLHPGVKGLRKKAREQISKDAGHAATYKIEYETIKPEAIGLPATTAIAVKAILRDDISMGRYILDIVNLLKAGMTKEQADAILGQPPRVIGFGSVSQRELNYIKMAPFALARKRAEADAIKQRFDLPFSDDMTAEEISISGGEVAQDYKLFTREDAAAELVEGEFAPEPDQPEPEAQPAAPAPKPTQQQLLTELGYS